MTEMTPETQMTALELRQLPGDWFEETGYIAPEKVIFSLNAAAARIEALERLLSQLDGIYHNGLAALAAGKKP